MVDGLVGQARNVTSNQLTAAPVPFLLFRVAKLDLKRLASGATALHFCLKQHHVCLASEEALFTQTRTYNDSARQALVHIRNKLLVFCDGSRFHTMDYEVFR